jgi:hypothetical protein
VKGSVTPQLYKLVDGEFFTCQTSSKPEKVPSNFVAGPSTDQQITRWSRTNPAGPLAQSLCEQTGTFFIYSDKKDEERTTNFPMPYDLPPNVAISGTWGSSVIVKEVTATGFTMENGQRGLDRCERHLDGEGYCGDKTAEGE